jgi:hypothetical protein
MTPEEEKELMAQYAQARNEALEEAARVAEDAPHHCKPMQPLKASDIAAAIRALKDVGNS